MMKLWEAPSCGRTSGDTLMASDWPSSEGPVRGGASWLWSVQALATAAAAAATAIREKSARVIKS